MKTEQQQRMEIVRDDAVCGGAAVIKGTRIGVKFLLYWLRQYNWDCKKVQQEVYPQLTPDQIREVVKYVEEHPEEFAD